MGFAFALFDLLNDDDFDSFFVYRTNLSEIYVTFHNLITNDSGFLYFSR